MACGDQARIATLRKVPMLNVMALGSLLVSLFVPALVVPSVTALTVPNVAAPAAKMVNDVVTVNGTGCPSGSVAIAISPDNTAFTVTYSKYSAQVGVGAKSSDLRKNCQLNLNVHVPAGYTYAVDSTQYRGFASLVKGASGSLKES